MANNGTSGNRARTLDRMGGPFHAVHTEELLDEPVSGEDLMLMVAHRRGHCPTSDDLARGVTVLDILAE